jgi:hypothetical protein
LYLVQLDLALVFIILAQAPLLVEILVVVEVLLMVMLLGMVQVQERVQQKVEDQVLFMFLDIKKEI